MRDWGSAYPRWSRVGDTHRENQDGTMVAFSAGDAHTIHLSARRLHGIQGYDPESLHPSSLAVRPWDFDRPVTPCRKRSFMSRLDNPSMPPFLPRPNGDLG
jgi:hypothetical protein